MTKFILRRFVAVAAMAMLCLLPNAHAAPGLSPRTQAQHLLRRFSFSASPAEVSAVVAQGTGAWLAQQMNWSAIDDSASTLESPPATLNADGSYQDYTIYERILMQHLLLTHRQLQAKLELHWLDHFAVSLGGVFDPAIMTHYEQTVRANALGNFGTLLAAVAKEPAMLYWLNNNLNRGGVPNENFARELMQLYSIGLYQLSMSGTPKLDGSGNPRPAYTQNDVAAVAEAMTGYAVMIDPKNLNPQTRFSVQFVPSWHYGKPLKFLGRARAVPNDATAIDFVANVLAHMPSTAPFMAREMLQRFVTETPSPNYIADIAAVWARQADAPDQIAQVVAAIVNHPEFNQSYHAMLKQPVEALLGALRQLPGTLQATSTTPPGAMLLWEMHYIGQQMFYPPSVFSFYRPGGLGNTLNTSTVLYRSAVFSNAVNGAAGQAGIDTYIDMPTLRARIGSNDVHAIAAYLMDALLDGAPAALGSQIVDFMGPNPSENQIRGAVWLLLNAPEYAVN